MAAGKGIVVLVVVADRRLEPLRQRHAIGDGVADDDARAGQNDGKFCVRQKLRRFRDGVLAAGRPLELDDRRQLDVDDLGPEVAGNVELRRRRQPLGLEDHAVERFRHARGIAHFLLVAHHVAEQGHLLDFLKAALADGLVRRLRRHHQHRRVVPVGRLHRRHEPGDAGAVLGDGHGHLPGRARVAVADQPAVGLVGDVPEGDAGLRKQVGNGHERRTYDAEGVLDAVHLQHFYEGFFGRHLHRAHLIFETCPARHEPAALAHMNDMELDGLQSVSQNTLCIVS